MKSIKISWLGLERVGKTSLTNYLASGFFTPTFQPTLGFSIIQFEMRGIIIQSWDFGGQDSFRMALWDQYLEGSKGIVYVIDSTQQDRFRVAKKELWNKILTNDKLRHVPLLILANKQDLPEAATIKEIIEKLDIKLIFDHSYAIFPTSAKNGLNVIEGMIWLMNEISKVT